MYDILDESLINMMRSLPPEVAERVRQKYEADRAEFIEVVKDMTPSKDPSYWAKRSCTRCYGRGILGTVVKPSGETTVPACSCIKKNYFKWLVEVRRFFNALKEQGTT